jgi:hypothetical protein
MLITNFSLDIIICISSNLYINKLCNFIIHNKNIFANKYAILRNNPHIIKFLEFDNTTSLYQLAFNNTISNIPDLLYDKNHNFNNNELNTITNIVSYYIYDNVLNRESAKLYLLDIYTKGWLNANYNYTNIIKIKNKNKRIQLCLKLFKVIFNDNWEYCNINLYDIFNIIYYIVYKKYNNLYEILYNIKINKSLTPLDTLHVLIKCNDDIHGLNIKMNNDICLYKCVIYYLLYNYIENIHEYIIQTKLKKLIPIILQKCLEIKNIIINNKNFPINLKLMFLKKIENVYNLFINKENSLT